MVRDYLKKLRKEKKLTQSDVSDRLEIGASTYTMVELGTRQKTLSLSWVEKLSNVFGVPMEVIIKNEKDYQHNATK